MANDNQRDPLDKVVESFVNRYRRGERPSVSEYAEKHPEHAERIEELFPTLVMMEDLAPDDDEGIESRGATAAMAGLERLGDYEILREVGRGGMGVVYEAKQESLGRHVALKVLPFHGLMDPGHLRRFRREARAAARLHHTNIVPVFEVGEHEGIHYYAMQFIHGQGLDEVFSELVDLRRKLRSPDGASSAELASSGPKTPSDPGLKSEKSDSSSSSKLPGHSVLSSGSTTDQHYYHSIARIGAQAADALCYAHQQGILHRDVKPSNLMLDTEGKVWVADFGLAKTDATEDLTHTGDLVGTLRYMAPERFDGWSDPRSDIYGLGLTLYEMLTLTPAFDESDRARLIRRITNEDLPRPRRKDRNIPVDLETIVLKSIAREPGERYQSADQVADDLQRFLNKQPIEARRTSFGERGRMWCRRNPLAAGLAAALAGLLIVGIGVASWAAWHFEHVAHQRQQALEAQNKLVEQLTEAKRIATERLYFSARFHYERREYEQAVEGFSALLEADPKHSNALWWRGLAFGHLDQCQMAVDDFSRYIDLHPKRADGYAVRGLWGGRGGAYDRAVEDYRKALELDLKQPAGYLNNVAWFQAMRPQEDRDLDHALQCSLQAVAKAPTSWTYHTTLGILYYRRQEYEQAINVLEKADKLSHRHPFHRYFLAMSHQKLGDVNRALDYYRQADKWAARDNPPYRMCEQTLYAREAEALITEYLAKDADHFKMLFRRALLRLRMHKSEEMLRDTTRMVQLRPELNSGYFWRGRARMSLRMDALAIQDFHKSLSIKPADVWPYRYLAWLYVLAPDDVRDLQKAEEMVVEARNFDPTSNLSKEILGLIHYRRGDVNEAVEVLQTITGPERYGVVQHVLALCYLKLGRPNEARMHLEKVDKAWGRDLEPFWKSVRGALQTEVKQVMGEEGS